MTQATLAAAGDPVAPLREFIVAATGLVSQPMDEPARIAAMKPLLARLVANDSWLPEEAARAHTDHYAQYLLHCDPLERFCIVSFVWGPGQRTPIHDHTVWGLIGMLRGAETAQHYRLDAGGPMQPVGKLARLEPGAIELVSPQTGDIHQVSNAYDDRTSISVHVYGANIGAVVRHVFDPLDGIAKPMVSGYSSATVPNLWDRSAAVRQQAARPAP